MSWPCDHLKFVVEWAAAVLSGRYRSFTTVRIGLILFFQYRPRPHPELSFHACPFSHPARPVPPYTYLVERVNVSPNVKRAPGV